MNTERFQEIQLFLNNENATVDERREYERLLEEFHQIPSSVERFTRKEETQDA